MRRERKKNECNHLVCTETKEIGIQIVYVDFIYIHEGQSKKLYCKELDVLCYKKFKIDFISVFYLISTYICLNQSFMIVEEIDSRLEKIKILDFKWDTGW